MKAKKKKNIKNDIQKINLAHESINKSNYYFMFSSEVIYINII